MTKLPQIIIHTDGACSKNPGEGGWAAHLSYSKPDGTVYEKTISGYSPLTTNNEMELTAVVEALKALKTRSDVLIYSDSAYIVDAINKGWLSSWVERGWKTAENKPVANMALWQTILELTRHHVVRFEKVKGHSDNEINNLCDKLARQAIKNKK
jgi:ribonuclease HI